MFTCIRDLTSGHFSDAELLITNLCNEGLPPSPRGKTVFIPRNKAEEGLKVIRNEQPYYEPNKPRAFNEVCGKKYIVEKQYILFPILHVKSYPLKGNLLAYEENYKQCRKEIRELMYSWKARNEL